MNRKSNPITALKPQPGRTSRITASALVVWAMSLWLVHTAQAQLLFDLDTGTPALTVGRSVPLDQTTGGVLAHFSSPQGGAFSIQTDLSTGYSLPQFSGHYLYPNNAASRSALDIRFSQSLTSISLTYATAENTAAGEPTTQILLTAYMDSTGTPPVGSATHQPAWGSDTFPMGTLAFSSSVPFNLVEIRVPSPSSPGSATDFFVDNIRVTPTPIPEMNGGVLLGVALSLFSLRRLTNPRRRA
jgi:hypothetical protein